MSPDETLRVYCVPNSSLLEFSQDHRRKFDFDSLPDEKFRVKDEEFASEHDTEEAKMEDASLDLDM